MKSQARRFCITLNNYSTEEYDKLIDYMTTRLFVCGKEIGKNNFTPHLQIYLESKTPIKFNTLKNLNNRMHIEKAKGNRKQNYDYCTKDGDFVTNMTEEDLIQKSKKELEIEENRMKEDRVKEEKDRHKYHLKNHRYVISKDTYDFYMDRVDIENLNSETKKIVINDIIKYKESLACGWCQFIKETSKICFDTL